MNNVSSFCVCSVGPAGTSTSSSALPTRAPTRPLWPITNLQTVGDRAYLRTLREAEMRAWESGLPQPTRPR